MGVREAAGNVNVVPSPEPQQEPCRWVNGWFIKLCSLSLGSEGPKAKEPHTAPLSPQDLRATRQWLNRSSDILFLGSPKEKGILDLSGMQTGGSKALEPSLGELG